MASDDGVIELRPALPVPADQAWFWAEQWQLREREVDTGRVKFETTPPQQAPRHACGRAAT